ncbi:hypothetical protein [Aliikangiella coralliicola]|uniref:Uncharacterized protein n=1 Tax=Aliikangiella coralliicola TaxID=2592383 RepID=A0A545U8Y3_9GAMM|nr:hypothetical protein [Aliikangiella coralliicola]TQV85931.1 hypothetical protein FLL46_18610 [Aliikangiella coralliicola]
MTTLAMTTEELPYRTPPNAACAAARVANVKMKLPGIPGEFVVEFVGTGTATIPEDVQNVFDINNEASLVDMTWYQNKFVGKHWLLGEFQVDLAEDKESKGTIGVLAAQEFGTNTVNTNDFYFDFKFKRFPFLNMRNETPIRNSAVISGVPPIGSVFKLDKSVSELVKFKIGNTEALDSGYGQTRTIKFNQCDVTVFPEQNVGLELIEKKRIGENTYEIVVEIRNITDTAATFAYFTVIHYAGIKVSNDYGFALLEPGATTQIKYQISSEYPERTVDIPFFAALYKPQKLNGSASIDIQMSF